MIGLRLSERYFRNAVEPLLATIAPGLRYGAARLGDGSEVLGYDTGMSADHNYGPTVQIVLNEADFGRADSLMTALDAQLPETFEGWPVRYECFGRPHRAQGWLTSGHGVELITLPALLLRQIGIGHDSPDSADWLAIPEQRLLTLTAGGVFRDDPGTLADMRRRLDYLPQDIWLAKLAAQWDRVGEERAFVGRTGDLGDDLGSRLVAARLVHDLMHIAFLVERRYAPYSKWFGTAFQQLDCAPQLGPMLEQVLATDDWQLREGGIANAAQVLAQMQVERGVPGATPPRIEGYFTRPFQVINADQIAVALRGAIGDAELRALPAGAIDQFVDATPILSQPALARTVARAMLDDQLR
jgi:hypothetical protein